MKIREGMKARVNQQSRRISGVNSDVCRLARGRGGARNRCLGRGRGREGTVARVTIVKATVTTNTTTTQIT